MTSFLSYSLICFGSIFSIVDPFAAVPIFLVLVGQQSQAAQNRIALRATLTCFGVLTAFAALGSLIFTFFGITVPAFKVAGGILLFGVAFDMLRAKPSATRATQEERSEAESKEDVGLIPMGIPLLSGPGAMATATVLAGKSQGLPGHLGLHLAIGAVSLLTLVVLRSSMLIARVIGRTGLNVIGRVMGLILAALAIQFVMDGVRDALPGLVSAARGDA
jgi:multiple antibiotic resistance protein